MHISKLLIHTSLLLAVFIGFSNAFPISFYQSKIIYNDLNCKRDIPHNNSESNITIDTNGTIDDQVSTETDEEYLARIKEFIYPRTWTWVLIVLHCTVFVVGLVGNILVCTAVCRNHSMKTVTNYFIVNLAFADFLVILLCLPPSVTWDVTMTWFFGTMTCKIVLYLQTVSVTVSVLTLTFISIDRWYAICHPLEFRSTTGRAKTAIGIIWVVALLLDVPELVVYTTVKNRDLQVDTIYFTQCAASWSREMDRDWTIFKMVALYIIPLIFMTIAYFQIIHVLWKSGNLRQHSLGFSCGSQLGTLAINSNSSTEGQLRSRKKAAKMLVAVVIMFGVCYFPVHILSVLRLIMALKNTELNRACSLISLWLCYANSAINPIIYNFMSGKFRKEFRRAFKDCRLSPALNMEYQPSSTRRSPTGRDSRFGSQSSKRTLSGIRRFFTINRSGRQSDRTVVTKTDI